MELCNYGCGKKAKYFFKRVNKWCCSSHANKCEARRKNISKRTKETMQKITKLENNNFIICSYGCGKSANYIFEYNNKFCCEKVNSKCPSLRKKTSDNHIGIDHNEETKKVLSVKAKERFKNRKNCTFYGKHHTEKTKKILSVKRKGQKHSDELKARWSIERRGRLNSNWRGGISLEPYCFEFTDDLKEFIKERDSYKCKNPKCYNISDRLCVHHIDYVKKNCEIVNLITLCFSCNSRANFNREYWKDYYNKLLKGEK